MPMDADVNQKRTCFKLIFMFFGVIRNRIDTMSGRIYHSFDQFREIQEKMLFKFVEQTRNLFHNG